MVRTPDPHDRRRNAVTLTDARLRRHAELAERAGEIEEELLEPLTAAEREQLTALLRKLLDHHRQGFPPLSPMS